MNKLMPDMNIGVNLRALRKKNGFTQDGLVTQLELIGYPVTRSLYSRYETGELNIPVSILVALREIYHCNYDVFFQDLKVIKK